MHAASCIPAVTGAWQLEGGGAFHINADIFKLDKTIIEGLDVWDRSVRVLDQSRIGAILTGDAEALRGGPPVTAMIVQNTNPLSVCPDQNKVKQGFAREDLFVCVHEQFMTETAQNGRPGAAGDDLPRARRHLSRRRPPIHHPRAEAGRAAGRMPQQSRGDFSAGQAARRRAPRLRHEPARIDRPDAAGVQARHACRARGQPLARLPAAVSPGAFPRRLPLGRRQVPLQAGLEQRAVPQPLQERAGRRDAGAAGPLDLDRTGRRRRIRSASPPRRRAASSIRPSTRHRPRWRRSSGRA